MQGTIKKYVRVGLLIGAILISILPVFDPLKIFTNLQNFSFDTFQRIIPRAKTQDDPLIIIDIDDRSLEKVGQWPWSRTTLGALLVPTYPAAALGFDIVFAEPDRTNPKNLVAQYPNNAALKEQIMLLPDNDKKFAELIKDHGTVVLGQALNNNLGDPKNISNKFGLVTQGDDPKIFLTDYQNLTSNIAILEQAAAGLGSMSIGNNDVVVRQLPTFEQVNGQVVPSIGLEMVRVAIGASTYQIKSSNASSEEAFGENTGINNIKLGPLTMPTTANGNAWIYYTPTSNLTIISAWDVLSGKIEPETFEGKVVLVGTSASGLGDLRSTPIEKNIPGVTIIGQFIQQIIDGTFLERPDWLFGAEFLVGLILSILITLSIQRLGPIGGLGIFLVGSSGIIGSSYYFFKSKLFLVDPISPLIICLLVYVLVTFFNFLFTELERSRVRGAFSQYLSPEMVNRLAESSESLVLGGERKKMTFLFSDIRGFTQISEQYKEDPEELTRLINELLTTLSDAILNNGGTIDKYMGDCIMAFWNAPTDQHDHAMLAMKAAQDMRDALQQFNQESVQRSEQTMEIGIGINSGYCIVGNMGSDKRFDYTVLGDSVNLAARLEGQSSSYGVNVMVGEATKELLSDQHFLELDLIAVKGKAEPVKVYTPFELADSSKAMDLIQQHGNFLDAYRRQSWDEALDMKNKNSNEIPELKVYYDRFEQRINDLRENPPGQDWNGVNVATTK
tara:strand:- start:959 stop:3148 length:2190 start_codon:yes stop_codon:yes gene_type:complete